MKLCLIVEFFGIGSGDFIDSFVVDSTQLNG